MTATLVDAIAHGGGHRAGGGVMMKCSVCGKGPAKGTTIYRNNRLGEMPADWRCELHLGKRLDPDFKRMIKIIEHPMVKP